MRAISADRPLRILIVDDCPDNRESLARLLLLWGHEVHKAHDGPSAIEAFQAFHPHVVLLDIGLPGMNGWEIARWIRRQESQPALLVANTGFGMELDKARSREAGFDTHLTKPADTEELQQLLQAVTSALALVGAA